MKRIQFGWTIPAGLPRGMLRENYMSVVKEGLELVQEHFDSLWIVDHLQSEDDPLLEGWTALTYIAALEPHLKFGHAVLCQSFRNPALLAKMTTTLQYLSGGRFILGTCRNPTVKQHGAPGGAANRSWLCRPFGA
jgi:alkanesulfonate monooxygenase SsuD/methylene tetrahydromethanopterin reductase-like flavin-dependent oxidoreductase (luciferase family)